MFQCPACGELMEILTNYHCTSQHNMTKKELVTHFGVPKYVSPTMSREIQNWIKESSIITKVDFEVAQAAVKSTEKDIRTFAADQRARWVDGMRLSATLWSAQGK